MAQKSMRMARPISSAFVVASVCWPSGDGKGDEQIPSLPEFYEKKKNRMAVHLRNLKEAAMSLLRQG